MIKKQSIFHILMPSLRHDGHPKAWQFWMATVWMWLLVLLPSVVLLWGVQSLLPGGVNGLVASVAHPGIVYLILGLFALALVAGAAALHRHWLSKRSYFLWSMQTAQTERMVHTNHPAWIVQLSAIAASGKKSDDAARRIDFEVRSLRDADFAHLQFPNFLAGALVGVGLIGTFVGLLSSLNELASLFAAMKSSAGDTAVPLIGLSVLVEKLQNPMKAMGTAFATSLYGLVGSLTLALMVLTIQRQMAKFWQKVSKQFRTGIVVIDTPRSAGVLVGNHFDSDALFLQIQQSHEQLESKAALLQKREEKFDTLIEQLIQVNSSVSREVVTGSQKLLNQFVELQTEQNANVLMLSRQLKHQQQTLVEAIENIQRSTGSGDRLMESLVVHTDALTNEMSKLTKAMCVHEQQLAQSEQEVPLDSSTTGSGALSSYVSEKLSKLFVRNPKSYVSEDPQQLFETIERQIGVLDQLANQSKKLNAR